MTPSRPIALLVTHGALGQELVRTVERILGHQPDVITLSNDGLTADGLLAEMGARIRENPRSQPVVVFTDLAAGSCGIASRRVEAEGWTVRRLTGVNLPMLLEFFHYRDALPLDELIARLEAKGKAGITVF
jgi:mannose/fructose-specific phosphotransferase system component IIA